MPQVSILLTCYNHLPYLEECVRGIWSQTFTDYEVIALDDGSTDGTREWLMESVGNDPRVKLVFNENNLGTYATLNVGLKNATGEFIAVLNDDDLWAPTKLQAQIELLNQRSDVGLVHSDGDFIDAKGERMEGAPLGFEFPRTETGDVLLSLMYANKIIASAVLARKACFEELGGFNDRYFGSGDWEMWIRIAEKWKVGFLSEKLTFYRVHGANASHRLNKIWLDDEMLRRWLNERSANYSHLDQNALKLARAHNMACLGTVLTLNGKPKEGREAFSESLRLDPTRWKSRLRWMATFLPKSLFEKFN